MQAFAPDPGIFEAEYLMEKLETKAGWSSPAPAAVLRDRPRPRVRPGVHHERVSGVVPLNLALQIAPWGQEHHAVMDRHLNHEIVLFLCGEDLPDPNNRVELDWQHLDEYGLPGAAIFSTMDDNGKRLGADMIRRGRELMDAAGADSVRDFGLSPVLGWHLMGTARMGNDPRSSVVDANNRAHDVPNLFIADAGSLSTGGGVHPTHTIQAVALRCAEHLWTHRHTF